MKFYFTICVLSFILQNEISGQFSDDFSDGNLDGWEGNVENFIVNASGQLQLNAPGGSTTSWIYTPLNYLDSMVWELYFKMDFAPSTSNQLRIYLGLTSADLSTASGYFLEIGASGDQDALDLKYLENNNSTLIASSSPALVASEPVELTLRIIRNGQGMWQVFKIGGPLPELLFTATHTILPLSSLNTFGYNSKYTDTRRDKFYFDNISITPLVSDQNPPAWLSLSVEDNHTLTLLFDESLDSASSVNPLQYLLTPGNLVPNQIVFNGNEISLSFPQPFISQQEYILTINNIKDLSGNALVTDSKSFSFIDIAIADPFDLLITEIMADPTPVIGLPDAEYLEIHNNSTDIFNLGDYKIKVGSTEKQLPDSLINPGEFVILTDVDNTSLLSPFGIVIGIQNMPTLTNSGTSLTLITNDENVIHEVTYSLSWYRDAAKSNGGWSLEMINPFHICADQENWIAASNLQGGTPGQVNTQWETTPDTEGPALLSLFTATPDIIELRFDERIEPVLMLNPDLYMFDPALSIAQIELNNPFTVQLTLSTLMQEGIIYELFPFSALDCLGNPSTTNDTIIFGLVATPDPGDVLINEILFNPATGGSRFIEVINVSQKFINLSALAIGRLDAIHQDLYPTGVNEILGPGEIAALTPNPSDILSRYTVPNPSKLYASLLPSWDDKSDNAAIIANGEIIDSFTYSSAWHHPVISDENGVSLERLSITSPTSSSANWHSSSSQSGYATPTGVNSQVVEIQNGETPYTITNKQFSPNDDGYKDFIVIDFHLTSGDDVGSVWVYDLEGREIAEIVSNESLGTNSFVKWDGRNKEDKIADMGIYILFIQIWDPAGNVKEYKESCALVKR